MRPSLINLSTQEKKWYEDEVEIECLPKILKVLHPYEVGHEILIRIRDLADFIDVDITKIKSFL